MKPNYRYMMALFAAVAWMGMPFAGTAQQEKKPKAGKSKTKQAAIFVFSRTAKVPEGQIKNLEDYLTAQVSDIGFQVMQRDVVLNSIKSAASGKPDPASLEAELGKASSAMRLTQNLGANLILLATINSYTTETRNFKGNKLFPVPSKVNYHRLRLTYSLAFGANGAAVIGQKVKVERVIRETAGFTIEGDDLLEGLMEDASEKLVEHITQAQKLLAPEDIPTVKGVQFVVNTHLVMPGGGPFLGPTLFLGGKKIELEANVSADVKLNGVSIGTTPGILNAPAGLSPIEVQRQGFKSWKRIINVADGLKLDINLEMTDEGFARWKEQIQFFENLEKDRKLTDAEAERIKAEAEALKEHGIIIRIDTEEGVILNKKNIRRRK